MRFLNLISTLTFTSKMIAGWGSREKSSHTTSKKPKESPAESLKTGCINHLHGLSEHCWETYQRHKNCPVICTHLFHQKSSRVYANGDKKSGQAGKDSTGCKRLATAGYTDCHYVVRNVETAGKLSITQD